MRFDLLAIWCAGVGLCWFAYSLLVTWLQHYVHSFASVLDRLPATDATPSVTVVVPARNEADRIEESVRRLLAQRAIDLELVVVDDRSDDGTSKILERLGQEDPRLRVIRVDALPERWLGKQHACYVGAREARGSGSCSPTPTSG